MAHLTYKQQNDMENVTKLRAVLEELPQFCSDYFRSLEIRKSTRTRLNYAYDLRLFFEFLQKNNPSIAKQALRNLPLDLLDQVTSVDIEEYLSYLSLYDKDGTTRTNTESGKARKLSSLRSFYGYYFKKKYIRTNPPDQIDTPKLKEKAIIRLDDAEVALLLDAVESGANLTKAQLRTHEKIKYRDLAILTLLLGTGIRVSECVGLNLTDINFRDNAVKIIRKGGNEDIVYFGTEVEEALRDYIEDSRNSFKVKEVDENALFISLKNSRISVRAVELMVKKYSATVTTLKKITPHKLRSTYGTSLYRETGDIYLVADVLGHKDVNTTRKHYAALDEDRKRKAANVVKLREP